MRAKVIPCSALAVASLAAAACNFLTDPTPACGSFNGRMSGVANDTISGCAFFSVKWEGDFGMILTNGDAYDVNPRVSIVGPHRPGGTVQLGEVGGSFCADPARICGTATFEGQTFTLLGTIVVTRGDTLNLEGSITVTGTSPDGAVLSISGDFAAQCNALPAQFEQRGDDPGKARKPTPCRPGDGVASVFRP
jgi:hypothetical protein